MTSRRPAPHLWICAALLLSGCVADGRTARLADGFEGRFPRGAVAADHAVASAAGAEMLARGGNAVDAAVAASFALSVVRPMSCGIGGGGFMVIRFDGDPVHGDLTTTINYRETAPAAIGPDYFESIHDPEAATVGGRAVGVPGTVRGLLDALERYGTLDRATIMAPAIRAADEGFEVDAFYLDAARNRIRWFEADPARKTRFSFLWKRFLREGQVKTGDRIRVPEQSAALRLIARDGADAFYRGPIAEAIVRAVQQDGGVLTAEDLAAYTASEAAPLAFGAFGNRFLSMPPPSSGGVTVGQTIQMYERVRGRSAASEPGARVHALVESFKHAFADRARWLGDPAFVAIPLETLLSGARADARAGRFDPNRTLSLDSYGTSTLPIDGGTSHLSVVDARGNAVACTETINLSFGAKLAVAEYGFCLNNQMDDFTTRRGAANDFGLVQSDLNRPEAGKRPLSSMAPTIVLDDAGRVMMVAGGSGGPRIITGTVQAMLRVLLEDAGAGEAVRAPRIHHQWQPNLLEYEKQALTEAEIEGLRARGHEVGPANDGSNVQLIRRDRDGKGWDAACDPRKGGRPAGH